MLINTPSVHRTVMIVKRNWSVVIRAIVYLTYYTLTYIIFHKDLAAGAI